MQKIEQVFIPVSRQGGIFPDLIQSADVLPIDVEAILESAGSFRVPQSETFDLLNLFFHHLPSGAYAVGRLIPALGATRVRLSRLEKFYLQYMVVPPNLFLRFGNNPVFLYQAVLAHARLSFAATPGETAEPITIHRPRKWFDIPLLRGLSACPGAAPLAKLADTILHSLTTMVTGGQQSLYVLSAISNLFPIRFRPELTFSSGVFFAPDRHFRVIGISDKNGGADIRGFRPVPYLNLDRLILRTEETVPEHGWQELIYKVLTTGQFEFFQARLISYDCDYAQRIRRGVPEIPSAGELDALGREWLADLERREHCSHSGGTARAEKTSEMKSARQNDEKTEKADKRIFRVKRSEEEILPPPNMSEKLRRWLADGQPKNGVHYFKDEQRENPRFRSPLVLRTGQKTLFSPFQRLLAAYPDDEKNLRQLDRMVAAVLSGRTRQLDRLTRFWNDYLEKNADDERKWHICEEYAHFIQVCLTKTEHPEGVGSPEESAAALDILNLFLNEGEAAEFSFDID